MKQQLTPTYDHEKITNPTCDDLIDVFEDAWTGYILAQVHMLLRNSNGDIAAMALLCSYFESIEALYRGESSDNRSREFFVQGFLRVFEKTSNPDGARAAAKTIYHHVRCGVAHTGFPTPQVHIQRTNSNAFILTYPLFPDGQLDTAAEVQSVLVNVQRMYDAAQWHLNQYLKALRKPDETTLRANFERLMRGSWGIGQDDNVVGMTEDEFIRSSPTK